MSIASIPQTALHMSRVQFYSCLKLIAAYQASIPLREELIASSIPLPLPKFSWKDTTDLVATNNCDQRTADTWRQPPRHMTNSTGGGTAGGLESSSARDTSNSDFPSTDSEVEHNDVEVQERIVSFHLICDVCRVQHEMSLNLRNSEICFAASSKTIARSLEHGQRQSNADK